MFLRTGEFHGLMNGRIISTILGNAWGFLGIGPLSTVWPFMAGLRTVMALVGMSFKMPMCYSEHKMRLKVSVQLLSCVRLFATPWTTARQASLSITNSQSLHKLMSIKLLMPLNHFTLCRPLFLPPSIFPSIRVFSSESVLCIRWPKYWSFSFSVSPSNESSVLISFRIDWFDLLLSKNSQEHS